jgi:adenylylsulfate kinase
MFQKCSRKNKLSKRGFAVWLTGLPGSGKSVISDKLKKILESRNIKIQILRMDEMRKIVTPEPKYSDEERQIIYNSFIYLTKILVDNNINVIMDATGNLRKYRRLAKEIIPNFMEIYLKCPLDIAINRESERKDFRSAPKDIYKKGLSGGSRTVPGIQSRYEEPKNPGLVVETDKTSIETCAEKISKKIIKTFIE